MSNKSEAAWHPNSGPVTDHADLAQALFDLALKGGGSRADALVRIYEKGKADALADSVPREQYENVAALNEGASLAYGAMRAERDALAQVINQVREWGLTWRDTLDANYVTADAYPELTAVLYDTMSAQLLARHDAEVKAQTLDEAAKSLADQRDDTAGDRNPEDGMSYTAHRDGRFLGKTVAIRLLRDRAAAIRAEANDHSN
jgi:hypothetical protein